MKRVIIITDADEYARKSVITISKEIGGYCLADFASNPTEVEPKDFIQRILSINEDPIYVLVDDAGIQGIGPGEKVIQALFDHPDIVIIGALAVASHTRHSEWTRIDLAINQDGEFVGNGVDKEGVIELEGPRINGDTVYILDQLQIPNVIAIGDIGKMHGKDDVKKGSPITKKALKFILEREGLT